jgi:hypothetical protein
MATSEANDPLEDLKSRSRPVQRVEAQSLSHRSTHLPSALEELTAFSGVTQNSADGFFADA